ncbi:uncharacterized protein LOC126627199 [Malus sylvestris]|uniref:uncharacterized protein LOC126627199 n=1 Tax=Malus sylvestris TaxID=3752 RepID=UPI0021AC1A77|nr:uncharacterized protein LOC126627199 [Malus sylvestris]XP_050152600.1 uncharacterized protein LOC126627199 [Malus sylvestris]
MSFLSRTVLTPLVPVIGQRAMLGLSGYALITLASCLRQFICRGHFIRLVIRSLGLTHSRSLSALRSRSLTVSVSPSHTLSQTVSAINSLIEDAIVQAERKGAKVITYNCPTPRRFLQSAACAKRPSDSNGEAQRRRMESKVEVDEAPQPELQSTAAQPSPAS